MVTKLNKLEPAKFPKSEVFPRTQEIGARLFALPLRG
jgi:hypothetical protein